jgi:hypothetical protein
MEKTMIEKQIEDFKNLVIAFDNLIKDMDNIIAFNQRQRTTFIEQRTQLNAQKDVLMSDRAAISKSVSGIAQGIKDAFGIPDGPIISLTNYAQNYVDRETARIEQTLKEQREWKAEHPGHQPQ